MASVEELMVDLQRADAMGDTELAQHLAGQIREAESGGSLSRAIPAALKRGAYVGLPSLPAETALNVADLARAGYGYVGSKLGMLKPEEMPGLLDRSKFVGSHEWLLNRAPADMQYRLPENASMPAKMLESAAELAPAGALSPAPALGAGVAAAGGALQRLAQEKGLPPSAQLLAQLAPAAVPAVAARTPLARPTPHETAVKDLVENKIYPMPGQLAGPTAQRFESKATSIPLVGDVVLNAQRGVTEQFNRALYRRALAPLGPEAAKEAGNFPVGRDGVARVGNKLSDAYEAALDKSKTNRLDAPFDAATTKLRSMVDDQATFDRVMRSAVYDRTVTGTPPPATPGTAVGQALPPGSKFWTSRPRQERYLTPSEAKAAESELGQAIRDRMGSTDERVREVSRALRQAQAELRDMIARNNPDQAPVIRAINRGWADLTQIETAAARAGSKEGVITPAQYRAAIKQGDKSIRDRQFARGQARNQTFAENAEKIIGNQYADSGTAGRYLTMSPTAWLAGAGSAIPAGLAYGPAGRWLTSKAASGRSDLLRKLRENEPYLTLPVTAGLAAYDQ